MLAVHRRDVYDGGDWATCGVGHSSQSVMSWYWLFVLATQCTERMSGRGVIC